MDPFTILTLVLTFVFGTIIGSFLNVVSLRLGTNEGVNGRSHCRSCGKKLSAIELIPIVSFVVQKGACRSCKAKISWQYPLIESCAGALFVAIFFVFPPTSYSAAFLTLIQIVIACLLLVIAAYDAKHKIIPDAYVYTFAFLALLTAFVGGSTWWHMPGWPQLLAGPILALPFALLWLVSKGTWMGLGDAKLALGIGWLLGLNGGVNSLILAFWIGAAASLAWLFIVYKSFKARVEIPFGPFLIIGMYLVLLFHVYVIDFRMMADLLTWHA